MSTPRDLPSRPDLRHLRDEARRRTRAGEFPTLAAAQFALARDHGFRSWPALKTFVETRALDTAERAAALVRSACSSDLRTARMLLDAEPGLARHDLATACATGEAAEVARRLERDPAAADRRLGPSDWTPLLYATFSRFLRADPARADGIVAVVGLLLAAGADPNATWTDGDFVEAPIFGASGIANHPGLTAMLLAAGADPNETLTDPEQVGESLYHAVEFPDPTCARLLLEAGTNPAVVQYCLGRVLDFDNPPMVELFLAHGARATAHALHEAVAKRRPARTVRALLDAGAPVDVVDEQDPTALLPIRIAARWGRADLVDLLIAHGADGGVVTAEDRALGAIVTGMAGDGDGDEGPDRPRPPADQFAWAVHSGDVEVVRRLLDAGAAVDGTPGDEPLGQACWRGHAEVVRLLVERGAGLTWPQGSPIGSALHGAQHCHDAEGGPTMRTIDEVTHGDYPGVVRALLAAGAQVPARLWEPDLDAGAVIAAMGVDRPLADG